MPIAMYPGQWGVGAPSDGQKEEDAMARWFALALFAVLMVSEMVLDVSELVFGLR